MIELGLSRISKLLSAAGPGTWKAVHIAGTNGKGSTAAFLLPLLNKSTIRIGRFTSPHLLDRWDCITLGSNPVSECVFLNAEKDVKVRDIELGTKATNFELLTATAFEVFQREKIDVGIVECGMGGRLDATNALNAEDVLLSIITKIGLDHEAFLGNTIEKIAQEKAGIMKKGVPVVVDGSNSLSVLEVLKTHAEKVGAFYHESKMNPIILAWTDLPLHQKQNLSVALQAFDILAKSDHPAHPNYTIDSNTLASTITHFRTNWSGRLQTLPLTTLSLSNGTALLDGAHNLQSAQVLRDHITQTLRTTPSTKVTWLLAMTKGKDIPNMIKTLVQPGDDVVATSFGPVDGMPWIEAEHPDVIVEAVQRLAPGGRVSKAQNGNLYCGIQQAERFTAEKLIDGQPAGKKGPLVIMGSLYLVSDILRLVRKHQEAKGVR